MLDARSLAKPSAARQRAGTASSTFELTLTGRQDAVLASWSSEVGWSDGLPPLGVLGLGQSQVGESRSRSVQLPSVQARVDDSTRALARRDCAEPSVGSKWARRWMMMVATGSRRRDGGERMSNRTDCALAALPPVQLAAFIFLVKLSSHRDVAEAPEVSHPESRLKMAVSAFYGVPVHHRADHSDAVRGKGGMSPTTQADRLQAQGV